MQSWITNSLFLSFLITLTFLFISCGEKEGSEEVAYVVAVEIISPRDNVTLAKGEAFKVEVDYARRENIIHNIKVEILDANGNSIKKLVEKHAHVSNEFTFIKEGIVLDEAGTYTIRASTTDLDTGNGEHGNGDGTGHDSDKNMVEHTIQIN